MTAALPGLTVREAASSARFWILGAAFFLVAIAINGTAAHIVPLLTDHGLSPQSAAATVYKVLESAVANAETTEDLDRADLVVSNCQVDEGPTMKRWRPRAQGRATRILKRTSHITLVVTPRPEPEQKAPAKAEKKNRKKGKA